MSRPAQASEAGGAQEARQRAEGTAREAARSDAVRAAGRAGLAAQGVVYVLIGVLAARIAAGRPGAQADRQGALHTVAAHPFGSVLIWALGVGFAGLALWRLSQTVIATGRSRRRRAGRRLLALGRAVFFGAVAAGTFSLVLGGGGSGSSDQESQSWSARAMGWPGGRLLVAAVGAGLLVAGVGAAVRAARRRFLRDLRTEQMSHGTRRTVEVLGAVGGVARGLVFAAAGVFLVVAAVRFDPHEAKGLDDTLRSFADAPAGPWLLAAVAAGLVLFGLFSFAAARFQRM